MKNNRLKTWLLGSLLWHGFIFIFIFVQSDFPNNFWGGGTPIIEKNTAEGVWVELTSPSLQTKRVQKKESDRIVSRSQPGKGGSGGSPTPEGGEGGGMDSSSVANQNPALLSQIRQKIMASRYYPDLARAQGIEGVVNFVFEIDSSGKLKSVTITQSSGDNTLDQAALSTLRRALPLPYYPGPIRIALKFALD